MISTPLYVLMRHSTVCEPIPECCSKSHLTMSTSLLRSRRDSARCEPMNPAPPVISTQHSPLREIHTVGVTMRREVCSDHLALPGSVIAVESRAIICLRGLLTVSFASAFYTVYGNHTYQSLRICPFQYEKRAGVVAPTQGLSRGQPVVG